MMKESQLFAELAAIPSKGTIMKNHDHTCGLPSIRTSSTLDRTCRGLKCVRHDAKSAKPIWRIIGVRLACVLFLFPTAMTTAKDRPRSAERPRIPAKPSGWEVAWTLQTAADGTYARIAAVTPYLSSRLVKVVHEVVTADARAVFTPDDVGPLGVPLGPEGAARMADIEMRTQVELHQKPRMEIRRVPRMTLYVQLDVGVLQAVDGETGRVLWSLALGSKSASAAAPAANDDFVAAIYGNLLTTIALADGKMLWQQPVAGIPAVRLAIDDQYVYAPLESGSIERYTLANGGRFPRRFYSAGRMLDGCFVQSDFLVWSTDRGFVHILDREAGKPRARLEIRDRLAGPVV
ncbi:MAG TPA: PQQ-binding-like beta-propeller repeat protein, partial [Pirellulaceae bacterium]